jgi:hypothetical protein
MPGKFGKVIEFAQYHPPSFQEAFLIGLREALHQLGRRDPLRTEWIWISKQGLPDALEDRSLHGGCEPRHERWYADVEKAPGWISRVPISACQEAKGSPVMR